MPRQIVFVSMFAAAQFLRAANPADIWPANVKAQHDPAQLAQTLSAINANAATLPQPLEPAIAFQKVFLQIISQAPEANWLDDLKKLAALKGDDTMAATIREKAKIWLARVNAEKAGVALRKYYADHVEFPPTLDAVKKDIPDAVRIDPWGKPWIYKTGKAGFSKIEQQRFSLTPTDYPNLAPLKKSVGDRSQPKRSWKITPKSVGGATALDIKSAGGSAVMQPGGKIDDCTLLFIGQNWALFAAFDQLFVATF